MYRGSRFVGHSRTCGHMMRVVLPLPFTSSLIALARHSMQKDGEWVHPLPAFISAFSSIQMPHAIMRS